MALINQEKKKIFQPIQFMTLLLNWYIQAAPRIALKIGTTNIKKLMRVIKSIFISFMELELKEFCQLDSMGLPFTTSGAFIKVCFSLCYNIKFHASLK